ncbi:MAG: radical SAM protein, partial [Deltaproteobacteria bacterium]|nr:radical SAM protein [Deltaproteobacteria bacterium]
MLPLPWRITFVTNPDECNLRCPMCSAHSDEARVSRPAASTPRRLALRDVIRAIDSLSPPPREVIPSTRGEPLLWDGLPGLAEACGARGISLNVTTNGSFPGRGLTRGPPAAAVLRCRASTRRGARSGPA